MEPNFWVLMLVMVICTCNLTNSQRYNPSIIQDSRDLPTPEGHFGFLYRTEDGISHAARGDPSGQVHGRFTYTDPTGLKVNYNYNAGSRATPRYNYNDVSVRRQPSGLTRGMEYQQTEPEVKQQQQQRPLVVAAQRGEKPLRNNVNY